MSHFDNIQPGSAQDPEQAKLAHELANLLDGSLRNLGLVMSNLHDIDVPQAVDDDLMQRLGIADDAMKQMATLLRRWMAQSNRKESKFVTPPQQARQLHEQSESLGHVIEMAVGLLSAAAASQGIDLRVDVSDEIQSVAAGPLYPVITNALRNSIEAIAGCEDLTADQRVIDLNCCLDNNQIVLAIRDSGPGIDRSLRDENGDTRFGQTTKPDGNGIGLPLARDIAESLQGSVCLQNIDGGGAEFILRVGVDSLS
jgi:signal transduction histidine kinase